MGHIVTRRPEKTQPLSLACIAITGVLAGGFLGGTTNAINGLVDPYYFVSSLRLYGAKEIWHASVARGVYEGLMFGAGLSLVFTVAVGIMTAVTCRFGFAFKHLVGIVIGSYVCWIFGGLAAIGLASFSPEFYRHTFGGPIGNYEALLRYAWVGGSIQAIEMGGLPTVILALVVFRANWRLLQQNDNDLALS